MRVVAGKRQSTCLLYPYHYGALSVCEGNFGEELSVSAQAVIVSGKPKSVTISVNDSEDWSEDVEVEPSFVDGLSSVDGCRSPCKTGFAEIEVNGPGSVAAHVQYPYALSAEWLTRAGFGGASSMGVGGAGASIAGEVGSRCSEEERCDSELECFSAFLGGRRVCSKECDGDLDCPNDAQCVEGLLATDYESLEGRCVRACSDSRTCAHGNSECGVQEVGDYCF